MTNPSGLPLNAQVTYWADARQNAVTLASDVVGDSIEVDVDQIMGSTSIGVLEVQVSDGLGMGSSYVYISVAAKPPEATILQPGEGGFVTAGEPLGLSGDAFDKEEDLTDAQLVWSSDRDGVLGTGRDIAATLSAGEHTITLTATDRDGLAGSDSAHVHVMQADVSDFALIPPDEPAMRCQKRVGKAASRLLKKQLRCFRTAARTALKDLGPADPGPCFENARRSFNRANQRLKECPACVVAKLPALQHQVETFAAQNAGVIYCGQETPMGNGKCQAGALADVGKLAVGLGKCHASAAEESMLSGKFDDDACEAEQRAQYDVRAARGSGCPDCLIVNRSALRDAIESFMDLTVNQAIFCAGRTPD